MKTSIAFKERHICILHTITRLKCSSNNANKINELLFDITNLSSEMFQLQIQSRDFTNANTYLNQERLRVLYFKSETYYVSSSE
jgi:phage regulator Rha-like protein